jgi:hypothetical protein
VSYVDPPVLSAEDEAAVDQQLVDAEARADYDDEFLQLEQAVPYPWSRPGWRPLFFEALMRDQRPRQGTLPGAGTPVTMITCGICDQDIYLDPATLYEVGPDVAGYTNRGRPPIDHFAAPAGARDLTGDWIDRLSVLMQMETRRSPPRTAAEIRQDVVAAYHRPGTRIVHKRCNLARARRRFGDAIQQR